MNAPAKTIPIKPADFASDQTVRWCPGCGDYAILKGIQKTLANLQRPSENHVFVSGIGCSSRLPYYLATYGFHTIHGRAPAVATGVKLANPDLDVWLVTGDGDGLSIGGNHLMHILRRNVDVQILLFNNEIYGLTKGQYSPTSREGTRSPSTPEGSLDQPVAPAEFALGVGARFVSRVIDKDQRNMPDLLERAHGHAGAAFVEIFQNCIVYNDDVFRDFTDKAHAAERQLWLRHGEPLRFGPGGRKGLRLTPGTLALEVVSWEEGEAAPEDLLVHDETDRTLAGLLAAMRPPAFPMALGVLYCAPAESHEQRVDRRRPATQTSDERLNALLRQGSTWTVQG